MTAHTDTIDHAEQARVQRYASWDQDQPLSEEEQAAKDEAASIEMVQKLADALLKTRKEAMEARANCGIETDWEEDEEFYQSIDKANPEGETNVGKPSSSEGGSIGVPTRKQSRSSVFVPLTRPYVDAAAARIADMLLPNDDMPWSLKATPIAEAAEMAMGMPGPAAPAMTGMGGPQSMPGPMGAPPAMGAPMQGAMPAPTMATAPSAIGAPMNPAQAVMSDPAAMAKKAIEDKQSAAESAAEEATKQITDWLIECQYHAEFRKMLENAAKLGTGILKGPVPELRVSQKMGPDGVMVRVEKLVPVSYSVDPRNFFPDAACGEDVQRGGYTWEYDTFSARKVEDLLGDDSYIESQVRKVIKEGPCKMGEKPSDSPQANAAERSVLGSSFGVWYFHGLVDRDTLMAAGVPEEDFQGLDGESLSAVITMINDTVVKATLSPLEVGGFPYDVMPWQRRAGMIWGMGVARQMRTAQRWTNAGARAMMDNAGFSSGPQVAFRKKWIRPVDGKMELTPRKLWEMTADAPDTAKIDDAISFTNIQCAQQELQAIINEGKKMAEDATGLPMLMQGQQGDATDTAAGMTILNNNGSTVLRRIARQADDCVTERQIRRYYHWLMENGDNEKAKGDFQIDARGSTALVDRQISNQALVNLLPHLRNDPDIHQGRLNIEVMKSQRIDHKPLMMTEPEKKERDAKKPMPPVPVMVAQLREQGATQRQEQKLTFEAGQNTEDRKLDEGKLRADYETSLGDLSLRHGVSKDEIKAMLAKTVMTLNTQIDMADADKVHQVATAAAEPAGRAPNGHAFQQ